MSESKEPVSLKSKNTMNSFQLNSEPLVLFVKVLIPSLLHPTPGDAKISVVIRLLCKRCLEQTHLFELLAIYSAREHV